MENSELDLNDWSPASTNFSNLMNKKGLFSAFSSDMLDYTMGKSTNGKKLRILDVACGAGSLTIQAAERVKNDGGTVVAVDLSQEFLNILQRNLDAHHIDNVIPLCMNGESMYGLESNQFDFVYSSFGLTIFQNRVAGIAEMHRTLKSGGKACITSVDLDWTEFEMARSAFKELGEEQDIPIEVIRRVTTVNDDEVNEMFHSGGFNKVEIKRSLKCDHIKIDTFIEFCKNPVMDSLTLVLPKEKRPLLLPTIRKQLYEKYKSDSFPFEGVAVISIGTKQ